MDKHKRQRYIGSKAEETTYIGRHRTETRETRMCKRLAVYVCLSLQSLVPNQDYFIVLIHLSYS